MLLTRTFAATLFILLALRPGAAFGAGSVQGFVYAQDTSQPLAGVKITASTNCITGLPCLFGGTAITATDGSFLVTDLRAGGGDILAYYDPSQANYVRSSQPLSVSDGQTTNVIFYLTPGASISGTVTRASDGTTMTSVTVAATLGTDDNAIGGDTTDAGGHYRISQLPPGNYKVYTDTRPPYQAEKSPYIDQHYAGHEPPPPSQGSQLADTIALATGQSVDHIDFSLRRGGSIVGKLTDRYSGLPIANTDASFFVYDPAIPDSSAPNGYPWMEFDLTTDANGAYTVDGLPDTRINLSAAAFHYSESVLGCTDPCGYRSNATVLHVSPGDLLSNVNFSLFPGRVISGTVTRRSDGTPIPNATVSATNDDTRADMSTTTDAQGHYVLTGLMVADYIKASDAMLNGVAYIGQLYNDHNCAEGACPYASSDFVNGEYHVTSGIDFQLDPGATIAGQVVEESAGAGIFQATVTLYASDGTYRAQKDSDFSGQFTMPAVQPGTYFLSADAHGLYKCEIYAHAPCAYGVNVASVGTPIVVGTTNVSGIVIAIPTDVVFRDGFE